MIKRIAFVVLLLACSARASLFAQSPSTFPGKVRIASTAADSLCVGATGLSPASTSCTGGVYAGPAIVTSVVFTSLVSTNGNKMNYDGANQLFIGLPGATSTQKLVFLTSGGASIGNIDGVGNISMNGALTATGSGAHRVGAGGTGAGSTFTVDGSTAAASAPYIALSTNSVQKGYLGLNNGIVGGTNIDVTLYAIASQGIKFYANAALAWGINSAGDWTRGTGSDISEPVGIPTITGGGGGSSTIGGRDYAFTVTFGSAPSAMTVTFGHAFTATPTCTGTPGSNVTVRITAVSTTSVTLTESVLTAGDVVYMHCKW